MLSEEEYNLLVKEYSDKWLWKNYHYPGGEDEEEFTIVEILVDRRSGDEGRRMDRARDDWGNTWFISELESADYLVEVPYERRNV